MGFTQKGGTLTRAGVRAASWLSPTPRQGSKVTAPAGEQRLNPAPVPGGQHEWPVTGLVHQHRRQLGGGARAPGSGPHTRVQGTLHAQPQSLSARPFRGSTGRAPAAERRLLPPQQVQTLESVQTEPTAWARLLLCSERMVGGCALGIALATLTPE